MDGSLREALERAADGEPARVRVRLAGPASTCRARSSASPSACWPRPLRNATKHADPTAIDVANVAGEDGELVLSVINDGVAPRRSRPGTGLGLRLAALEAIAARRRWSSSGRSAPTAVELRFSGTPAGGRTMSESLRVLVVDDHDVVHWGFRLLLGEQPWVERCFSARDGDAAVALARRYRPDVALVDLFLGDRVRGRHLRERARGLARHQRAADLGRGPDLATQPRAAAGAAGFVSKDWTPPTSSRRCAWSRSA